MILLRQDLSRQRFLENDMGEGIELDFFFKSLAAIGGKVFNVEGMVEHDVKLIPRVFANQGILKKNGSFVELYVNNSLKMKLAIKDISEVTKEDIRLKSAFSIYTKADYSYLYFETPLINDPSRKGPRLVTIEELAAFMETKKNMVSCVQFRGKTSFEGEPIQSGVFSVDFQSYKIRSGTCFMWVYKSDISKIELDVRSGGTAVAFIYHKDGSALMIAVR